MSKHTYRSDGLPSFWWLNPWGHAIALYKMVKDFDSNLRRRNAELVAKEDLLKSVLVQWRKDQYELYELKKK